MKLSKEMRDMQNITNITASRKVVDEINKIYAAHKNSSNIFSKKEKIAMYFIVQGLKLEKNNENEKNQTIGEILNKIRDYIDDKAINENLMSVGKLTAVNETLPYYIAFSIVRDPIILIDLEDLSSILSYLLDKGFKNRDGGYDYGSSHLTEHLLEELQE